MLIKFFCLIFENNFNDDLIQNLLVFIITFMCDCFNFYYSKYVSY